MKNSRNQFSLGMYRVYGNGPTEAIRKKLATTIPVYNLDDIKHWDQSSYKSGEKLVSPVKYTHAPSLARPMWTDHPMSFRCGRIEMTGARVG